MERKQLPLSASSAGVVESSKSRAVYTFHDQVRFSAMSYEGEGLDLDRILEGQSTDGEEDGQEEEALERRLQEILDAAEQEDEEEQGRGIAGLPLESELAFSAHIIQIDVSDDVSRSKEVPWSMEDAHSGAISSDAEGSTLSTGSLRPGAMFAATALVSRQASVSSRPQYNSPRSPQHSSVDQFQRENHFLSDDSINVEGKIAAEDPKCLPRSDDEEFMLIDPTETKGLVDIDFRALESDNNSELEENISLLSSESNLDSLPQFNDKSHVEDFETVFSEDELNGDSAALKIIEDTNEEVLNDPFNKTQQDFIAEGTSQHVKLPVMNERSLLDIAEDAEKNAAYSGLHLEEGAVAQPMQLKGIQAGPPPISYLHMDLVGSVSEALLSSSNSWDNGTGQALAVTSNTIAVGLSKGSVLLAPTDAATFTFLSSTEKTHHSSVTSLSFNNQGDLLLVGHASGALVLWDVTRAVMVKFLNVEHNAAVVHTAFLGQDLQLTRHSRAVSADCKGLVLLHTFTFSPLLKRFSVETKCLVDGQKNARVLCLCTLLLDTGFDAQTNVSMTLSSKAASGLSSVVGGMVGGVVVPGKSPDTTKRLTEGASVEDPGGIIVFVTHQTILVVRLVPQVEVCAKLSRPNGIRDGGVPYAALRRVHSQINNSSSVSKQSANTTLMDSKEGISEENIDERHLMLALAWDKKLFILQLLRGELKVVTDWDLDAVACGVAWLEEQMVVVLTSKEQLCLFTKDGVEIERAPTGSGGSKRSFAPTYNTHILNMFGNPEKAYHNSMVARGAAVYLLEALCLWRARLLSWQDRIKALQNAGDWMGAFQIGMEVYNGSAFGVIGLPKEVDQLQKAVTPVLLDLLFAYIDEAFTYLSLSFGSFSSAKKDEHKGQVELAVQAKEQYARIGGVAVEFCVHIHRTDVLFDHVFSKFCTVGQRATFLELLEPYILKDVLGSLAPEVMQALVEYYSQKGWVQRIEQCVLHMDIASLDFNQVMRLCRENGLYSALIYLFNKGLDDFKSPLEELLSVAQNITNPNSRALGYKMLVYLKYCFLGLAFPSGHGQIDASRRLRLRAELLGWLLESKPMLISGTIDELPNQSIIVHPRLCFLLSFDLVATLEVLHCAFAENGLIATSSDVGVSETDDLECFYVVRTQAELLQDVINSLVDILEWVRLHLASENDPFDVNSPYKGILQSDMGRVMEFIAEYVALNKVKVARVVLAPIIRHLAFTSDSTVEIVKGREDRNVKVKEKLLIRLLKAETEWDFAQTLDLALRSQFWEASAYLLARKGDYVAALDSHLKDRDQPQNAFSFIVNILDSSANMEKHKLLEFRSSVLARLPELLQLSSEATLVIMLKHFNQEHKQILSDLAPYPPLLFQYLKQVMNARLGFKYGSLAANKGENNGMSMNENIGADAINKVCSSLIGHDNLQELLQNAALKFTNEMEETYVELLCQFDPKSVLKFLKTFEDYRLEHCLKLCQDYGIMDAAAYLFERVGDVGSALSLVIADMDAHIHSMDTSIARLFSKKYNLSSGLDVKETDQFLKIPEVADTYSVMQVAIELCQRNTWRMNAGESEALWFRLFDRFVDPLRKLHSAKKELWKSNFPTGAHVKWKVVIIGDKAVDLMQRVLVYLIGEIVNGMMGYIPSSAIMDKLLSDNGSHEFGDFKSTILGMLGSYSYEQNILFTAKHVVEDDMFRNISIYKMKATRGLAPNRAVCFICNQRLDKDNASSDYLGLKWKSYNTRSSSPHESKGTSKCSTATVMVFFCGHAVHCNCITTDAGVMSSKSDIQSASCPVCPRKLSIFKSVNKKQNFVQAA